MPSPLANPDLPLLLAAAGLFLAVVALLAVLILARRQRRLLARYRKLLAGPSEQDVEGLLLQQLEQLEAQAKRLDGLDDRLAALTEAARLHIQKVAVIRYNAFKGVGSDLSFSLALLDANLDGVILSSLYGGSEAYVYAKPIVKERSSYKLSDEEEAVLAEASGR